MLNADKVRVAAAFRAAVDQVPGADMIIEGLKIDGREYTLRQLIERNIENGEFYDAVDQSRQSVDWWVENLNKNGLNLPGPSQ